MLNIPHPDSLIILFLFGAILIIPEIILIIWRRVQEYRKAQVQKRHKDKIHDLPPVPPEVVVEFLKTYSGAIAFFEKLIEQLPQGKVIPRPITGSCLILTGLLNQSLRGMNRPLVDRYMASYREYTQARDNHTGFLDIDYGDWEKMSDTHKSYIRVTRFLAWVQFLDNSRA